MYKILWDFGIQTIRKSWTEDQTYYLTRKTKAYKYIYICVCVCVCVWLDSSLSFKHVWLNNKDTLCLYDLIKTLSSFLRSVLLSGWNWWMTLPRLSRVFRIFHRPSSGVACMCKECFKRVLKDFFVFIT